jgi:hypothetical protein
MYNSIEIAIAIGIEKNLLFTRLSAACDRNGRAVDGPKTIAVFCVLPTTTFFLLKLDPAWWDILLVP